MREKGKKKGLRGKERDVLLAGRSPFSTVTTYQHLPHALLLLARRGRERKEEKKSLSSGKREGKMSMEGSLPVFFSSLLPFLLRRAPDPSTRRRGGGKGKKKKAGLKGEGTASGRWP